MKTVDWYFDFISPYAYLASQSLHLLPDDIRIRPQPVLFAGLLNHWDTKGPAEIQPMRQYLFRHIAWVAQQHRIPLNYPPRHPFNPLKLLRLCLYKNAELGCVLNLFSFVWERGKSSDNPADWEQLCAELDIAGADEKIADPAIKEKLRSNTELAVERGVFGVPTFIVDKELFFGHDSMPFLSAYLENPSLLRQADFRRADNLPDGIHRK